MLNFKDFDHDGLLTQSEVDHEAELMANATGGGQGLSGLQTGLIAGATFLVGGGISYAVFSPSSEDAKVLDKAHKAEAKAEEAREEAKRLQAIRDEAKAKKAGEAEALAAVKPSVSQTVKVEAPKGATAETDEVEDEPQGMTREQFKATLVKAHAELAQLQQQLDETDDVNEKLAIQGKMNAMNQKVNALILSTI